MKPLRLAQLAQWCGGRLHGDDAEVDAVSTDTRTLAGDGRRVLFVALKGGNFDGHDALSAFMGGASSPTKSAGKPVAAKADPTKAVAAALVSRELEIDLPQVVVADTERALGAFAAAMQERRATKVLAVTGSNGKTSVKSLLLAILAHAGEAYANPGNRNNEIGLPLAVIEAPDDADFAVYEMGAGKPGDIAYLTGIARPDVALVNNIAPAHLERMGSLLGVADTKAAIYDALPAQGVAVINADDAFAPFFEQRVFADRAQGRRILRFGLDASAEVTARDIVANADGSEFTLATPAGETRIELALPGHAVENVAQVPAREAGHLQDRIPQRVIEDVRGILAEFWAVLQLINEINHVAGVLVWPAEGAIDLKVGCGKLRRRLALVSGTLLGKELDPLVDDSARPAEPAAEAAGFARLVQVAEQLGELPLAPVGPARTNLE